MSHLSRAGRVVLNNLSEEIRECYRHAEDCALKSIAHHDPQLKQDFLDLEQRWLFLARSYELSERLINLSDETKQQVPLGRGCTYEDVCNIVVFLASAEASYMTGQAINVTGGQEMR